MKISLLFAVVFAIAFFIGCNRFQNKILLNSNSEYRVELSKDDVINLELSCFTDLVINDTAYLTFFSKVLKTAYFKSIRSNKIIDSLIFPNELNIGLKEHIEFINKDYACYLDSYGNFHLIRSDQKETFQPQPKTIYMNQLMNYSFTPMVYDNFSNSVYVNIAYANIVLNNDDSRQEYYKRPFCYCINLEDTGKSKILDLNYPFNYRTGKNYAIDYPIISTGKNNIIFGFKKSHKFYCYDPINEKTKIIKAKSKFIDNFNIYEPDENKAKNRTKLKRFNFEEPGYKLIIYDRYHDLYLRIVKHRGNMINRDDSLKIKNDPDWSVIFMSSDFHVLNEQKFNGKDWYKNLLAVPEGILIPKVINVKDKQIENHIVIYTLFTFEN